MLETIYELFKFLTDVPINFWGWLLPVSAPLLVFCLGPDKKWRLHLSRLLLAVAMTYVLWNLTIHTHHHIERVEYESCQAQFSDGEWQMHEECGNPFIGNGAQKAFALVLGWIPAAAYIGILEAFWRIRHRRKIKEMGKEYKGRWFSNIIIGFAVFLCVIYPLSAGIGLLISIVIPR